MSTPTQKPILRVTRIPIYGTELMLSVSENLKSTIESHRHRYQDDAPDEIPETWDAVTFRGDGFVGMYFAWESLTPGTLAHEIFHAALHVMRDKGDTLTKESEEAHAYLVTWLTNWVYDQLEASKKQKKAAA